MSEERLVMQNGAAYSTVEVPAAPKKKSSLKRLVASAAAVSLALGFATVTAVNHGLMNFSSNNVQISLRGTKFCLGVQDHNNADKRSKLVIYECKKDKAGQTFQMESVGGGAYNIKYKAPGRTLCVNYKEEGSPLQLYSCKSGDAHSEWTLNQGKLMVKAFDKCMAPQPVGNWDLYNGNWVEGTDCGNAYTRWNVGGMPTPRPTPRPTAKPQSSQSGCDGICFEDYDCHSPSCPKCLPYGDGVRKTCQKQKPEKGQCNRSCRLNNNYDCHNDGGKFSTGQPWCGTCGSNGYCKAVHYDICDWDWDCDRIHGTGKTVCGPHGYCVGK